MGIQAFVRANDPTQILQKIDWFESEICVSCASFIATLLTIGKGPFLPQNFAELYGNNGTYTANHNAQNT